jgi:hypothetical protein
MQKFVKVIYGVNLGWVLKELVCDAYISLTLQKRKLNAIFVDKHISCLD